MLLFRRRSKDQKARKVQYMSFFRSLKSLSGPQRSMIEMQLRNANKSLYGRITEEDKNLALSFYKASPFAYRVISALLVLPSRTTIKRHLGNFELDTGVNSNVTAVLESAAKQLQNEKDETMFLMFDEAFSKAHIWYDYKKDEIIRFEDFGQRRTHFFADHILTFMIRGLYTNMKCPVTYYFCSSQTKFGILMGLIRENVKLLKECGLDVVVSDCDQGTSNVKSVKKLRAQYLQYCFRNGIEAGTKSNPTSFFSFNKNFFLSILTFQVIKHFQNC